MSIIPKDSIEQIPEFDFHVSGVCNFMNLIAKGLQNPKARVPFDARSKLLGDRSTYIGASAATGCLYKAYMDVFEKKPINSKQVFVFERGHQLEEMIRKGLNGLGYRELASVSHYNAKYKKCVIHQEEVQGMGDFEFIKAHIDFVFVNSQELVIKEIKSSASIPTQPYLSHVYQALIQMWLLKEKYPDRKVRASVVYHNWDTGDSEDYPIEYNITLLNTALNNALNLWTAFFEQNIPAPERQLYCSKCSHKNTCPALCLQSDNDLPQDLLVLVGRLADFKSAEKTMKKLKDNFLQLMMSSGLQRAKIGEYLLEVCNGTNGSKYLKIT